MRLTLISISISITSSVKTLIIMSTFNKLRIDKFNKVLSNFLNVFLLMVIIKKFQKKAKTVTHPDFDIWILTLDPSNINEKAFELIYDNLGSDKVYVLSDYNCNKNVFAKRDNVNLVKNEITDLKNEDFNIKENKKTKWLQWLQ